MFTLLRDGKIGAFTMLGYEKAGFFYHDGATEQASNWRCESLYPQTL